MKRPCKFYTWMAPIICTSVNQPNRQKLAGNIDTKSADNLTVVIDICDSYGLTSFIGKLYIGWHFKSK